MSIVTGVRKNAIRSLQSTHNQEEKESAMTEPNQNGPERVGGASALDEALRPAVSNALSGFLDWVLDVKPINEALKYLSPSFRQMSSMLPMAAGYGFAKLPMSLFPNPTVAHFFQD